MKIKCLALLMALLCVVSLSACDNTTKKYATDNFNVLKPQTTTPNLSSVDFVNVAETDKLILGVNHGTGDIQVTVKQSGYVWSTATHRPNDSMSYNLFSFYYEDKEGNNGYVKSTADCIANGQYEIENIENGIKMRFSVGEATEEYIFPNSFTPKRYEKFYNKADDEGKSAMEMVYYRIDFAELDEISREAKEKEYPNAVDGVIYGMRQSNWNDVIKERISLALKNAGYTKEDLKLDGAASEEESKGNRFDVTLYFTLENDKLVLQVPYDGIKMSENCYIRTISLLESFSGTEMDDGYFLLPDGSGSVMNFNNGRENSEPYRLRVYGNDNSISQKNSILGTPQIRLPVYGAKQGDNAFFAIIRDADALAYINAYTGTKESTPRVWSEFEVLAVDYMTTSSTNMIQEGSKLSVFQAEKYKGNIEIEYNFLTGNNANYSGMAKLYSEKLFGNKSIESEEYPLNVEFIVAVDTKKQFLGTAVKKNVILTDLGDIEKIISDIKKSGTEKLSLKLSGWFENGYRHGDVDKINFNNNIMSKKDLLDFTEKLEKEKVDFYPDVDVQYTYSSANSQPSEKDVAVMLNEKAGQIYNYDLAVYTPNTNGTYKSILNPDAVVKNIGYVDNFFKDNKIKNYSLRSIGTDLNADYAKNNTITRQETLNKIKTILSKNDCNIMFSGGNAYTLPFANNLIDIPIRSARHDQTDYDVPFMAMVLSGRMEYYSAPINLSGESKADILRIIESGAAPRFLITSETDVNADLKEYNFLYSSRYDANSENIKQIYNKLNNAVGDLYGKRILNHEQIERNVFKTVYETGEWVVVNHNLYPVNIEGRNIEAYGFLKGSE